MDHTKIMEEAIGAVVDHLAVGRTADDRGDAGDDRRGEVSEGTHGGENPSTEEVGAGVVSRPAGRRPDEHVDQSYAHH